MSRFAPHLRRPGKECGYVLLMVLAAMATMAFIVGEFAHRIDAMRQSSRNLQAYAQGRVQVANAFAVSTFWLATRRNDLMGLGDGRGMVFADGRVYRLPGGAIVRFQDMRGLLSLNFPQRPSLQQLLINDGVPVQSTDGFIDTLLDYVDADSLKRLNGAEAADYAVLGLPPPRNDWLRSYEELASMPMWRDDAARLARLHESLGVRRSSWINPNTAPEAVLRAIFPRAAPEQIQRLQLLRSTGGFPNSKAAQAATGLDFGGDEFLFFVGPEIGLTIWAPGLPRAIQYNLTVLPGGAEGPWLVTEQHSKNRPNLPDDISDIPAFPLEMAPADQP